MNADADPSVRLPVVLVHGGLYDAAMDSDRFWGSSRVVAGLRDCGLEVQGFDRPARPTDWAQEGAALAGFLRDTFSSPALVVAASNGCSTALRVAVDEPDLVARLMLCWPATADDPVADELARVIISEEADDPTASRLLAGTPVRGVTEAELATINVPCVVFPCLPENQFHQRSTVTGLLAAIPDSIVFGGSPDPMADDFPGFRDSFVSLVADVALVDPDD